MRIRITSSLVLTLFASLAAPAQSPLVLAGLPNASTTVGGALAVDVWPTIPLTLTQIDFWTGAGTLQGSSVSVSIYFNAGGSGSATTPGVSVLIGSTVPVMTAAGGPQLIAGAIVVPAAPFAAVTLPATQFGLTFVANNCSLGATIGHVGNVNAHLIVTGAFALGVFPFTGPGATFTDNRSLIGALRYTVGGTPINLQENVAYGASCFGLSLVATGVPTPGGTMVLTTSNPTNVGLGLCILATDGLVEFPSGFDLGFIGAPGCRLHVGLGGVLMLISNLPAPLPGMSVLLPVPASFALLGVPVYSQSVWMDPTLNPSGIATSNGVRIRIG
ncbi:MAG TPA: hypothetical protein VFT55_16620 [Planctomycetota bacterium]|nr:hypothetical protein [Planctomycetota bacterium]